MPIFSKGITLIGLPEGLHLYIQGEPDAPLSKFILKEVLF